MPSDNRPEESTASLPVPLQALRDFLKLESAGGILLLAAAALALILSNSPLASLYEALLELHLGITLGDFTFQKTLLHWINDGLMAVFFFLVGLEIRREWTRGELADRRQARLPLVAALGGMALPALIYSGINWGDATALRGWAIPAATDIAFALGVVALLGSRVPPALKVFLAAVAIIDDLGAIVIIALFYTDKLSLTALGGAGIGLAAFAFLWK